MASTANPSSQIRQIGNNFEVSNHTFLNQITTGIQERVGQAVPNLSLVPTGKKASKGQISLALMGQVTLENSDSVEEAESKVRQLMDWLKNPSNLLSLLGG